MVNLSHDELGIIEYHSIKDGLHSFRATFNATFPNTNAADLKDLESRILSHDGKPQTTFLSALLIAVNARISSLNSLLRCKVSQQLSSFENWEWLIAWA